MNSDQINNQDWTSVVLQKTKKVKVKENDTNEKKASSLVPQNDEHDGDVKKPRMFTVEFGRRIQQFRAMKKMSRKDLARKMNQTENVLESIENGKHLYSGPLVSQLKKILGNDL
jgi:ribosome-binding protein aMBF1 (putative translation factor)